MAHYTFDIIKYTLITEEGETYKDFIEMMPSLTVQATNYIAATLKAEKAYPSDIHVTLIYFLLSDFNSTKEGRKTLFVIFRSFSLHRIFRCSGLSQKPSVIFSVFSSQSFLNAHCKVCGVLIPFEEFVNIGLFGRLVKKLHQVPA